MGGARATGAPVAAGRATRAGPSSSRRLGDGRWLVRLDGEPAARSRSRRTSTSGSTIPSGIRRSTPVRPGSAAAPTAGLHFTAGTLDSLDHVRVTLHVGLDTFRPVAGTRLEEHVLLGERYAVDTGAWAQIAGARRVLAVGTTTVRVIETRRADRRCLGTDDSLHRTRLRVQACRRVADQLPPPALDAVGSRHGFRRHRRGALPLSRRDRRAIPLLLVRRCDGRPVTAVTTRFLRCCHAFGTISCPMRQHFLSRLKVGGGEGWPQGLGAAERSRGPLF